MSALVRLHGGPDAQGVALHDFSTNSNACGPCPAALAAVRAADPCHYPDPNYPELKRRLADFHAVAAERLVLAASASEFIFRITAWLANQGGCSVAMPTHSYGDYRHAAQAYQLDALAGAQQWHQADLRWACEPSSPLGVADENLGGLATIGGGVVVLDRAYEPLRLSGQLPLKPASLNAIWQLWTPNKALGLSGIRAAYAIAPSGAGDEGEAVNALGPSWPIGAHGVAMLAAWTQPQTQTWLAESRVVLRQLKTRQIALCESLGWACLPSDANFFCARPALPASISLMQALVQLRAAGIKLRATASFGLPEHVRISVQAAPSQDALQRAWQQLV